MGTGERQKARQRKACNRCHTGNNKLEAADEEQAGSLSMLDKAGDGADHDGDMGQAVAGGHIFGAAAEMFPLGRR